MWRGFPNVVTSVITLPNIRKPDGYDYYAFSKGKLIGQFCELQVDLNPRKHKCNLSGNSKRAIMTVNKKPNFSAYSI